MRSLTASTTYDDITFSVTTAPDSTPEATVYAGLTSLGSATVSPTGGVNEYSVEVALPGNVTDGQIITVAIDWIVNSVPQQTVRLLVGQVGVTSLVASAVKEIFLGDGPRSVAVTVEDGDETPLSGQVVAVYASDDTPLDIWGVTNASGLVTFGLADGSYKLAVASRAGYEPHTPEALTVDGSEAVTLTLTATGSIEPPDDPLLSTLVVKCVDENGSVEEDVTIEVKLVEIPSGGTGIAYDGTTQSATSDVNGNAQLTVVRNATYLVRRGESEQWTKVTIADEGTTTITSFVGTP